MPDEDAGPQSGSQPPDRAGNIVRRIGFLTVQRFLNAVLGFVLVGRITTAIFPETSSSKHSPGELAGGGRCESVYRRQTVSAYPPQIHGWNRPLFLCIHGFKPLAGHVCAVTPAA